VEFRTTTVGKVAEDALLIILWNTNVKSIHTPLEILEGDASPILEIKVAECIAENLETLFNIAIYQF